MRKLKLNAFILILTLIIFISSVIILPVNGAGNAVLSSASYSISGTSLVVTANVTNFAGYNEIKWNGSLTVEHKVVVDFTSCRLGSSLAGKQISVKSDTVNIIRFGQYNETTARMVIEVNGTPSYKISSSSNGVTVTFYGEASGASPSPSVPAPTPTSTLKPVGTPGNPGDDTIFHEISQGEGFIAIDTSKLIKVKNEISIINGTGSKSSKSYNFIIDGAILGNYIGVENINDSVLKIIKMYTGNPSNNFIGISLSSAAAIYGKPVYIKDENLVIIFVSKTSIQDSTINAKVQDALKILGRIEEKTPTPVATTPPNTTAKTPSPTPSPTPAPVKFNNFTYYSGGDRVYFDIKDYALTGNLSGTVKYYTEKWISSDEYQITFNTPSSSALRLGSGTKNINDAYLKWVSVSENSSTGKTTVTFKLNGTVKIVIMTNRSGDTVKNTAISFIKPAKKSDKVIVIDPGHGGFDTGAVANGLRESDLNLDIGLRVEKYLEDRGYNAFMTRETDVFVGLYERAYIANELNAVIFMSIHNNAVVHTSDVNGTETFYTTADANSSAPLKSRDIAMFVQTEMIKALGSKDRGYKAYNDLIVIKATKMPASLAEVGFVTSKSESAKLADPAYRQKAAEAIAKGLISSLGKL